MTAQPEPPAQLIVDLPRLNSVIAELRNMDLDIDDHIDVHNGLSLALVTVTSPVKDIEILARDLQDAVGTPGLVAPNRFAGPGISVVFGIRAQDKIPHAIGEPTPFAGEVPAGIPGHGEGVRVGILDTPLYAPPKLAQPYESVPEAATLTGKVKPRNGHSLFVAGLVRQHVPAARLTMRSVPGLENGSTSSWETAKQMMEFLKYQDGNIDILNISLGARNHDAPLDLTRAVERLSSRILVIAAAGNYPELMVSDQDKALEQTWPAAIGAVIAVGADGAPGEPARFSPRAPWVDCWAPGVNLTGTYLEGMVSIYPFDNTNSSAEADRMFADAKQAVHAKGAKDEEFQPTATMFHGKASWSGTSFAAANATGIIADELAKLRRTRPEATAREAFARVLGPDKVLRPTS